MYPPKQIGYIKLRAAIYCQNSNPFLVDSKGIEPSNLTDANRALSQLSYEPILHCSLCEP